MRLTAVLLVTGALTLGAAPVGASLIGLYQNTMETEAQQNQLVKLGGERCGRAESSHTFKIIVGKQTSECAYRTPIVGRDLEIAAVERLLGSTPKALQRKAFLAVNLRTDSAGTGYELAVYPGQAKVQLRKTFSDGHTEYLHIEKNVSAVKGIDKANELRLRAFNIASGPERGSARILGFVGGEVVAEVTDPAAGELEGQASGFSVGAATSAMGATASVDNVVIRIPSPF